MASQKYNFLLGCDRGIIVAADVPSLDDLRALTTAAAGVPEVVAIKVGFTLALRHGLSAVVSAVNSVAEIPVIYDHQKAATDIPQMGRPFANVCRDAGVQGVIFFPQAGPKTLEGFVQAAVDCALVPIVGLAMTHPEYLQSEGGYILDTAPELIAQAALSLNVSDFVLPGTKPNIVSRFAKGALASLKSAGIMMPGIGSQGGSLRVAFTAAQPHRRFAIIGSAIYAAPDPKAALTAFAREVRA